MSQHRDHVEQKGSQIVHIRGDSDSDLEALFKAVMNPSDTHVPLTVPMRLRKLPNSFFKPPDTGSKTSPQSVSHSRESSADSTSSPFAASPAAGAAPQQQQPAQQTTGQGSPSQTAPAPAPPVQTASGLPIHHPRAHSSPASLQQNLAAATSQHLRTQSYEIQDDVPLPPGWEMAKTPQGQRYFLNHITQTTTWEDPRRKISLSAINLHTPSSGSSPSPPMNPLSPQNLGPLPENWEQATTQEGEVYFINHQARTTSWFDPRIPMHLQRPAVLLQAQQNQAPSINAATSQQNQQSTGSTQPTNNNQMNLQQHQQRVRLQRLQMERERLRLRQQEIMRQLKGSSGNALCQQQNFVNSSGLPSYMEREQQRVDSPEPMNQDMLIRQTLNEGITSSPTTELPPVSTTGIDPFLGGSDFHSRQESTDSGLGMGTNYSLPHTPEDFLSNIDDSMDPESQDGNPPTQQTPSGDLGSLDLQNTDIANLGESNMDSDDLEPSLQEELSSDLLNDVEALLNSNRMDNVLTWL